MIRRWLIAGLLVWVPLVATIWVLQLLNKFLNRFLLLIPPAWRPAELLGFDVPGLGVGVAIIIILITGFMAANIAGKKVLGVGEMLLAKIPLVRTIYSSVKQLTETVLDKDSNAFRKVLLVEWPRRDLWTMAFQTGECVKAIQDATESEMLTIFVPTTPNPTSGFIMFIPKEDAIELDVPVEGAVRMIISLGSVAPDGSDRMPAVKTEDLPAEKQREIKKKRRLKKLKQHKKHK